MKKPIKIIFACLFLLMTTHVFALRPPPPPALVTIANGSSDNPIHYRLQILGQAQITKGQSRDTISSQWGFRQIYLAGPPPIELLLTVKNAKQTIITRFKFSLWQQKNTEYQQQISAPNYQAIVCGSSPNNFDVVIVKKHAGLQLPPGPC